MNHPLLDVERIEQAPDAYLHTIGSVFAVFDEHTQDSGNISYGVQVGGERYFIKTAGRPEDPLPFLRHPERVSLLRNAIRLRRSCGHPALPCLHQVIESPDGPLLVYQWVDGERLGADRATRDDPRSTFQRFRRLPVPEIARALDVIYELHDELARSGWIAVDFYDGSILYDFGRQETHIVDLDLYRDAPFTNEMGRMFGSSRFMAPEEFERGALIDERTNVFTMGRTAAVLLSDGTLERLPFRGSDALYDVMRRACRSDRSERFASMAAFYTAWREARRF
jgi:serine/threonine-protein kinase